MPFTASNTAVDMSAASRLATIGLKALVYVTRVSCQSVTSSARDAVLVNSVVASAASAKVNVWRLVNRFMIILHSVSVECHQAKVPRALAKRRRRRPQRSDHRKPNTVLDSMELRRADAARSDRQLPMTSSSPSSEVCVESGDNAP